MVQLTVYHNLVYMCIYIYMYILFIFLIVKILRFMQKTHSMHQENVAATNQET